MIKSAFALPQPLAKAPRVKRITVDLQNWRVVVGYALLAGIVIMFAVKLFSVNYNVAAGYRISSLQKRIGGLSEENKRLVLKSSETLSIASIQEDFSDERYIPVTAVEYIQVPDTQFGLR